MRILSCDNSNYSVLPKHIRVKNYKAKYVKCARYAQYGFTSLEMMYALSILAFMVIMIHGLLLNIQYQLTGERVALQAFSYAKIVDRYITLHYVEFQDLLSNNGESNGGIITIPRQVLLKEGFVDKYPITNGLGQHPCIVVTWGGNQLETLIYYRSTSDSKSLKLQPLYQAVDAFPGLGIYSDGTVIGAGKSWRIDNAQQLLLAVGTVDPSGGANPNAYKCEGNAIANNSYVSSLSEMSRLLNPLPNTTNLAANPDDSTEANDSRSNSNVMLDDLDMHYQGPNEHGQPSDNKSNIIFQNNPDCLMDNNDEATLTDRTEKNLKGCRDKQLGLAVSPDEEHGGNKVTVTGFEQGGDEKVWGSKTRPWVGHLVVGSFQPTTPVPIGTACKLSQLGTMAKQPVSSDSNDVNNLNVSQVQCMLNPLCPQNTNGVCFMPLGTVTIRYRVKETSAESVNGLCPAGMFISAIDADSEAPKPSACCGTNWIGPFPSDYCCHIDDCNKGGGSCSRVEYAYKLASQNPVLYQGFFTTPSRWYQGCPTVHGGCNEGWGQKPDSYVKVRSVICTNDVTQVPIEVQVND